MRRLADLILFLLPLSLLLGERPLVKVGEIPIYWFEAGTIMLLVVLWAELVRNTTSQLKKLPRLVGWGMVALVVGLVLSTLTAEAPREALGALKAWFVMPMLLGAIIFLSRTSVTWLINGIIAHAVVQTLCGLIRLPDQEEGRLLGCFTSANFYAAVVVPAAVLALSLKNKVVGAVLAIFLLIGLILSQSLGGILGAVGAGTYLVITSIKSPLVRMVLTACVGLLLIGGGFAAYQRFSDNPRSSLASRQEIWDIAWLIGKDRPLTGVGLRNFDNAYLEKIPQAGFAPIEWNVPEPHNLYLAFWLNLSLIGAVGILLLLAGVISGGGVIAATLVALLVHGLVDTPIFKLELALLFWLYVSVVLARRSAKANLVG